MQALISKILSFLVFLSFSFYPSSSPATHSNNQKHIPACLQRVGQQSNQDVIEKAKISDHEILSRLVFAEGISTNFGSHDVCKSQSSMIFESIAWGVMNRVRISEKIPAFQKEFGKGIVGVVFKPGQFNPAVSKRSQFSKFFLCPSDAPGWAENWRKAEESAQRAIQSPSENPFLETDWERQNGMSWVVQFYYPKSIQATLVPPHWADVSKNSKTFVRKVQINGSLLSTECIWFFRRNLR
jgi:hypothetical protein